MTPRPRAQVFHRPGHCRRPLCPSLLSFPNPKSSLELRVPCTVTGRHQPITQQDREAPANHKQYRNASALPKEGGLRPVDHSKLTLFSVLCLCHNGGPRHKKVLPQHLSRVTLH